MEQKADRLLFIALIVAILFHGSALLYNLDKSYDAFVHIFFADHYARFWFEPWEYRWYTGFTTTSYPPLGHQLIALLSKIGGLKFGFITVILSALCFFLIGIYRFSQLWVSKRAAAYATIFALVASSIIQTIHIYGQMPTMVGIACLTNVLPEVYGYFRTNKKRYLITSVSILGVTVASHHVTTIFGMVFFIMPVIATALLDEVGAEGNFFMVAKKTFLLAIKKSKQFIIFFAMVGFEMVFIIFSYWYWSKTDPITQVSIPHGSRDSFIEVTSSGLMFFLIPLGFTLLMLPYIFISLYQRRNIFLALSFSLLLLLGTGGTTPFPMMILGKNAFNILTLDRFTFWASVIAIPFIGDFFYRLIEGDMKQHIINKNGKNVHTLTVVILASVVVFQGLFIINFHKYRPLQPVSIDIQPIVNFLERDQHDRWRYMTLGFGDQMAWLAANTNALSIDGNYHSARRVPEMTSQPLERLENSKFKGIQGLGSLQQFLTIPEKYYLKFIFSNDKFYDPILYFTGWERVQRLENGIMVWQKHDVPPLPSVLPSKEIPTYQKLMWGITPVSVFIIMLLVIFYYRKQYLINEFPEKQNLGFNIKRYNRWLFVWMAFLLLLAGGLWLKSVLSSVRKDPKIVLKYYYKALDFKYLEEAYSYFIPNSIDLNNYVLQLSVRDGLLASYGKLDSISIKILEKTDTTVKALVSTDWVTPLEKYHLDTEHNLVKQGSDWMIAPPIFSQIIVPDEHIEKGILAFHSQGKRKITLANTEHDDILDRPEVYILSSKLIKENNQFVVVGEVQNIDHLPAHLTIEAQLFDVYNRQLISYNAKYTTIHKILPKEITAFRIEFEETAWLREDDSHPLKFDPKQFSAVHFERKPVNFKVLARAVVTDHDMYRDAAIQHISIERNKLLKGDIFNYGTDEITIPQILFTYYDKDETVLTVRHLFMRDGIRQQAKLGFSEIIPDLNKVTVIKVGTMNDFYTNGLPQNSFQAHFKKFDRLDLIPLPDKPNYLRLQINSYIGNPTIY